MTTSFQQHLDGLLAKQRDLVHDNGFVILLYIKFGLFIVSSAPVLIAGLYFSKKTSRLGVTIATHKVAMVHLLEAGLVSLFLMMVLGILYKKKVRRYCQAHGLAFTNSIVFALRFCFREQLKLEILENMESPDSFHSSNTDETLPWTIAYVIFNVGIVLFELSQVNYYGALQWGLLSVGFYVFYMTLESTNRNKNHVIRTLRKDEILVGGLSEAALMPDVGDLSSADAQNLAFDFEHQEEEQTTPLQHKK